MREARFTVRWEGPDKRVREWLEEQLDCLFFDLTMQVKGITFADADFDYTARLRQSKPAAKTEQHDDSTGRAGG